MCPKVIYSCEAKMNFPHHYSSHMIFRNYANLLLKTFLIIITAENGWTSFSRILWLIDRLK